MPSILEPGASLASGRYHVLSPLGAGGYGEVWKAKKRSGDLWDRTVAVKVMLPLMSQVEREKATAEFIREAKLAAQFSHPNVISVTDFGSDQGGRLLYFEMPLVEGSDLAGIVKRSPNYRLPLSVAGFVMGEVLKGLDYVHRQGVVYRDIKGENVLVSHEGAVLLADFGIARSIHRATMFVKGTPGYVAPELADAKTQATSRADLFGVGVMFYRLLTGHALFAARSIEEGWQLAKQGVIPPMASLGVKVPKALEQTIRGLLDPDPAQRPQSAAEARELVLRAKEVRAATSDDLVQYLRAIGIAPIAEAKTKQAELSAPVVGGPPTLEVSTSAVEAVPLPITETNTPAPVKGAVPDAPTIDEAKRKRTVAATMEVIEKGGTKTAPSAARVRTPKASEPDHRAARTPSAPSSRRRWIMATGLGVALAAAAILLVVLMNRTSSTTGAAPPVPTVVLQPDAAQRAATLAPASAGADAAIAGVQPPTPAPTDQPAPAPEQKKTRPAKETTTKRATTDSPGDGEFKKPW